jgi:hypothetical protein
MNPYADEGILQSFWEMINACQPVFDYFYDQLSFYEAFLTYRSDLIGQLRAFCPGENGAKTRSFQRQKYQYYTHAAEEY